MARVLHCECIHLHSYYTCIYLSVNRGLLGAHFAAEFLRDSGHPLLQFYKDELVEMATHIGDKLLPAFNTTTGIPYSRVSTCYNVILSVTQLFILRLIYDMV